MSNAPMIRSVSHNISSETKNQAIPSVRTASGSVSSFRSGFRIVFSTPKTSAAQINVQAESLKLTPLRIQPATPRATAFATHDTRSHLITSRILLREAAVRLVEEPLAPKLVVRGTTPWEHRLNAIIEGSVRGRHCRRR